MKMQKSQEKVCFPDWTREKRLICKNLEEYDAELPMSSEFINAH